MRREWYEFNKQKNEKERTKGIKSKRRKNKKERFRKKVKKIKGMLKAKIKCNREREKRTLKKENEF